MDGTGRQGGGDEAPRYTLRELGTVGSTNDAARAMPLPADGSPLVVTADYQTRGRGSGTNSWESERGKNLLFSLCARPRGARPGELFDVSRCAALSVAGTLLTLAPGFRVKWPNDVYHGDRKVCGMLIENELGGGSVLRSTVGVGLNVNQLVFRGDAPNPVSLARITGRALDRRALLDAIVGRMAELLSLLERGGQEKLRRDYLNLLYRRGEPRRYRDSRGEFTARIEDVEPGGRLVLRAEDGGERRYEFKEVKYII